MTETKPGANGSISLPPMSPEEVHNILMGLETMIQRGLQDTKSAYALVALDRKIRSAGQESIRQQIGQAPAERQSE